MIVALCLDVVFIVVDDDDFNFELSVCARAQSRNSSNRWSVASLYRSLQLNLAGDELKLTS